MKKLKKLTLKSIGDDRLNNREMKLIFGGTYGDSYGGYGGDEEIDCIDPLDPSKCRSHGSECKKMDNGKLKKGECNAETSTHCYCIVKN
jgi:natural product precursor